MFLAAELFFWLLALIVLVLLYRRFARSVVVSRVARDLASLPLADDDGDDGQAVDAALQEVEVVKARLNASEAEAMKRAEKARKLRTKI